MIRVSKPKRATGRWPRKLRKQEHMRMRHSPRYIKLRALFARFAAELV